MRLLQNKIILIIICIGLNTLKAQHTVYGKIINKDSLRISGATVTLYNSVDSLLYKTTTTSSDGKFLIKEIQNGKYFFSVTAVGYKKSNTSISLFDSVKEKSFGYILLQEQFQSLDTVIVFSRPPSLQQTADKMVLNVKDNVANGGKSVLDVLEKAPGIAINKQTGNVAINGKSGVTITINGEPTYMSNTEVMQLLSGMSSNNVKQIELISVPTSNYDAEGSGVINIVINKNKKNGSGFGLNISSGYGRGAKIGGDLNYYFHSNRLQITSAYSLMNDVSKETWTNERNNFTNGIYTKSNTTSDRNPKTVSQNLRADVDYSLTNKISIGGVFSGYQRTWKMNALNNSNINNVYSTLLDSEYYNLKSLTTNVYLKLKFSTKDELSVNTNYIYHNNIDNHLYYIGNNNQPNDTLLIDKTTPLNIYVTKIDYLSKPNEKTSFGLGLKNSKSTFKNDITDDSLINGISKRNTLFSNVNSLTENTSAAYAFLQFDWKGKAKFYIGTRYEHTNTIINDSIGKNIINRKYGFFFPSIVISKAVGAEQSISLSYNKRITRPSFSDLAPFVLLLNPSTYYSGNDSLKPTITDAIKFDYGYKKYYFSIEYSVDKNAIIGFQPILNIQTNQEIISTQNFDLRKTFNCNVTIPISLGHFFSSQNIIAYTWQNIYNNYNIFNYYNVSLNSIRINSTNTFYFSKKYTFEISGMYRSPFLSGSVKNKAPGGVDVGLQKEFKNKSKLRISLSDIFKTNNWYIIGNQPIYNLNTINTLNFETRVLRMSYSISLGSNGAKKEKKLTGSEDEQSRTN